MSIVFCIHKHCATEEQGRHLMHNGGKSSSMFVCVYVAQLHQASFQNNSSAQGNIILQSGNWGCNILSRCAHLHCVHTYSKICHVMFCAHLCGVRTCAKKGGTVEFLVYDYHQITSFSNMFLEEQKLKACIGQPVWVFSGGNPFFRHMFIPGRINLSNCVIRIIFYYASIGPWPVGTHVTSLHNHLDDQYVSLYPFNMPTHYTICRDLKATRLYETRGAVSTRPKAVWNQNQQKTKSTSPTLHKAEKHIQLVKFIWENSYNTFKR